MSTVSGAREARGLAVIIDVFRAFTTAAHVMANGAERIVPVESVEESFELRGRHPDWIQIGERGGIRVEGFDYGNSPYEVSLADFSGRTVIQTTGAGNDIERASDLARKMVCDYGMSENLGPMTFGKKEEQIFLGREIAQHRDYSELTAQKIDEEVRKIVTDAYADTSRLIEDNSDILHRMANALLEKETLNGSDIDAIIANKEEPAQPEEVGES